MSTKIGHYAIVKAKAKACEHQMKSLVMKYVANHFSTVWNETWIRIRD